jgi:hypothetical protein
MQDALEKPLNTAGAALFPGHCAPNFPCCAIVWMKNKTLQRHRNKDIGAVRHNRRPAPSLGVSSQDSRPLWLPSRRPPFCRIRTGPRYARAASGARSTLAGLRRAPWLLRPRSCPQRASGELLRPGARPTSAGPRNAPPLAPFAWTGAQSGTATERGRKG